LVGLVVGHLVISSWLIDALNGGAVDFFFFFGALSML
jgi:hypothetical protein